MKLIDIIYRLVFIIPAAAAFIILVLLFGCEQRGKDGYYFEQETKVETELKILIVPVQDRETMTFLAESLGAHVGNAREIMAFSVISPGRCTIYMLDPRISLYEPEWIGHEFTHCVYGEWHKIQP